ncbi:MAG: histidine--tRNA ligase [Chloroflexi bacterium UTCFX4]|jgi:histidyl-tRNA synthetase|nr:MAG: histidine--tRNA ligase [Chloroflexi bacterium UTCFX4]
MATWVEPRLPRGMRDILPQKMLQRRYVMRVIENVFERFGFEPLQTPALELAQTLLGKYGPDAEKLIYDARHREGKEELALRYDLSVPLSRVVAMNPELTKPFKRYQIAPVWRAERPQKGRYREFYQCDADIVGATSMLADAEIIAMIFAILSELGFKEFVTKLNHRQVLTALGEYSGVPTESLGGLYRAIDKLEKIGRDGVRAEMVKNQIPAPAVEKILALLDLPTDDLAAWRETLRAYPRGIAGIDELEQLTQYTRALGVNPARLQVDLTMVRGLEYYTGPIFETVVTEPKIGSLTGGGRYDGLIGLFSKTALPATGTTVGIERIIDVMDELRMFPPNLGKTVTQVLVTVFDATQRAASIALGMELRAAGVNTEVWYDADGLGKQLKYAAAKAIPFALIAGPDEDAAAVITLRDLNSGEQSQIARGEIIARLGEKIAAA